MSSAGGRSSVFELMLSPRVKLARILLVLSFDAALVAGGIVMIRNWFSRSQTAAAAPMPAAVTPAPPPTPAPPLPPPSSVASVRAKPGRGSHPAASAPAAPVQAQVPSVIPPAVPAAATTSAAAPAPAPPDAGFAQAPPDPPPDPARIDKISAGIRYVVELHRDQIEECYRRSAKGTTTTDPLAGRLEVHLRVLSSGEAEDVRIADNQTGSEPLGTCLVALMAAWRYPSPGEPMDFVWPFTFQGH